MGSFFRVLLIRFAASPVAFLAAVLLLPLAGMILFQSPAGALLVILPPVMHLAGALLLRRAHPALVQALEHDLVARGLELCEANPGDRHFTRIEPEGHVRVPPLAAMPARLKATVMVPKESWLVAATLEGALFPPRRWRPLEFAIQEQGGLEIYLREISHAETAPGRITLHTTGGSRIDLPDGRDESGRFSEYLRGRLRGLERP